MKHNHNFDPMETHEDQGKAERRPKRNGLGLGGKSFYVMAPVVGLTCGFGPAIVSTKIMGESNAEKCVQQRLNDGTTAERLIKGGFVECHEERRPQLNVSDGLWEAFDASPSYGDPTVKERCLRALITDKHSQLNRVFGDLVCVEGELAWKPRAVSISNFE